jgi:hypothetical protein
MNTKNASKPNFNPNEADLSRQVVPNPLSDFLLSPALLFSCSPVLLWGERPADPGRRLRRLQTFPYWQKNKKSKSCLSCKSRQKFKIAETNPIFSRPNMHYQYQKRRNGGQKPTQKNETNPIVDNFVCP